MNGFPEIQSAQILSFPVGGRASVKRFGKGSAAVERLAPAAPLVSYDSWYHDEAIREDAAKRD